MLPRRVEMASHHALSGFECAITALYSGVEESKSATVPVLLRYASCAIAYRFLPAFHSS